MLNFFVFQVRKWLKENPKKHNFDVSKIDKYHVDHIIPQELGGHDYPYNYFLMEEKANEMFNKWYHPDKLGYISREVAKEAQRFAVWCKHRAEETTEYGKFVGEAPA